VRDPDRMAEDGRLYVPLVLNIDAAHELDQITSLRALMRALGVYRLTDMICTQPCASSAPVVTGANRRRDRVDSQDKYN
jgi:hypothetical protein